MRGTGEDLEQLTPLVAVGEHVHLAQRLDGDGQRAQAGLEPPIVAGRRGEELDAARRQGAHRLGDVGGPQRQVLDAGPAVPVEELVDLAGITARVRFDQRERHRARLVLNHLGDHRLPVDLDPLVEDVRETEGASIKADGGVDLARREADGDVVQCLEHAPLAVPRSRGPDEPVRDVAEPGDDRLAPGPPRSGDGPGAARDGPLERPGHVVGAEGYRGHSVPVPPHVAGGGVPGGGRGGQQQRDGALAQQDRPAARRPAGVVRADVREAEVVAQRRGGRLQVYDVELDVIDPEDAHDAPTHSSGVPLGRDDAGRARASHPSGPTSIAAPLSPSSPP